jgi:hypothetical protein
MKKALFSYIKYTSFKLKEYYVQWVGLDIQLHPTKVVWHYLKRRINIRTILFLILFTSVNIRMVR